MALPAGARLGPYEILSSLGAGGMGEVYRARDTRLGRDVAIKIVPPTVADNAIALGRFEREAKAVAALSHPNILTIYDFGQSRPSTSSGQALPTDAGREVTYAVMELLEGQTLRERLSSGALPVRKALDLAAQIAHGLAAAHARGIIHRDVKPANLMVGDDGVVKVLDFGVAKLLEPDGEPGAATATDLPAGDVSAFRHIAGTPAYMAPEQAAGGKVDARSDVFSFGAVLYEMATGTRAFDGRSSAETLAAVLAGQPKPPTQITAVPRELERVILRCLRKEPDRRYQTMLDVRNDLSVSGWARGLDARSQPVLVRRFRSHILD